MSETLEKTALAVIPATTLPTIIAADKDDILGKLAAELRGYRPDATTPRGREEIASKKKKVGSAKMDLVRLANGLTEGWRKSTAAVVAERKVVEERLDALRDEIDAPLAAFKSMEAGRVKGHEDALAAICEPDGYGLTESSAELNERLAYLRNYPSRDWQEFADRANGLIAHEIGRTEAFHFAALQREAEAAELTRLRAEAEERARQDAARAKADHERRIAAEAAETARLAAEREAQRVLAEERARAAAEALAAQQAAEAERQAAAAREREIEERAAKAERDRVAAIAKAEQEARDAEARRAAAEEKARTDAAALAAKVEADRVAAAQKAERERSDAIEAERRRVLEVQRAEEAEAARRAANKAHQTKINREVLAAFLGCGLTEDLGKVLIGSIVRGEVPHVTLNYSAAL